MTAQVTECGRYDRRDQQVTRWEVSADLGVGLMWVVLVTTDAGDSGKWMTDGW